MRPPRQALIADLVGDLAPVSRAPSPARLAAGWLVGAMLFVVGVSLWAGPWRPGVGGELVGSPRFACEMLLGLLAGATAMRATLQLGIPGSGAPARRARWSLLLLAAWLAAYLYGLADPALQPSMLGKREACDLQALAFSLPPLAAALVLLRRAAPVARVWSGALAGAAAGALGAGVMQVACMYDPAHILLHHLPVVVAAAAIGGLLGPLVLRRI